jgi:putative aldouronate transport system permease protein
MVSNTKELNTNGDSLRTAGIRRPWRSLAARMKDLARSYRAHSALFLMLAPALIYYAVFKYAPIYGVTIAFKDFRIIEGILGSPWVGLKYFERLFSMRSFFQVVSNTVIISFYKLLIGFPAPILFAILLNEIAMRRFKKVVQTISYLPHFLSWVVLASIFMLFLSPSAGPVNHLLKAMGFKEIYFLAEPEWFRGLLVATHVWKTFGWSSIVYLATLSNNDTELYDAAWVDGANRLQRMRHVTLPGLAPVITIMFIFAVGQLLSDDFDQIYNLYSPAVYSVADVISTYTYRVGLLEVNYSLGAAVGLFRNAVAFALILVTNTIARRISDYGLW